MPEPIQEQTIKFSGNRKAIAVISSVENAASEIQSKLNLSPYKAIILVFGSAEGIDEKNKLRLTQLCRRGIASAAADSNAIILDGGTKTGIAMLMGSGVANRSTKVSLIGVAPQSMVDFDKMNNDVGDDTLLEPNHSHFVLVQEGKQWGSEMPTLFSLADALIQPQSKQADLPVETGTGAPAIKPRGWRAKSKKEQEKVKQEKRIPAIVVLMGGGQVEKDQLLQAVRRKISLIVVKGSGGLADDIADACHKTDALPDDPDLAEIIADGDIHLHLLSDLVDGMKRLIQRELATDKVLQQAWQTFATYDLNAGNQQSWFRHLQMWIICVGLVGTAMAVSDEVLKSSRDATVLNAVLSSTSDTTVVNAIKKNQDLTVQRVIATEDTSALQQSLKNARAAGGSVFKINQLPAILKILWALKYLLILIPVGIAALVAAANRFKQGTKWMLLRAGAESIKREIYKYRVKGYYKEYDSVTAALRTDDDIKRQDQLTPEQELTQKVENITRRVMRTEVNTTALIQYTGDAYPPDYGQPPKDDGFSQLTPDKYVEVRLDEQLKYFQGKTPKLQRQYFVLHSLVLAAAAAGTLLSAFGWPVWIALTTAIAAAFTSYLGYMQVEPTLTKYNQAATDLENVKGWWNALSASEQAMTKNIQLLVDHTEDVLQTELDGWVQQMKDALETLRKDQAKDDGKKEVNPDVLNVAGKKDDDAVADDVQAKAGGNGADKNAAGVDANGKQGADQNSAPADPALVQQKKDLQAGGDSDVQQAANQNVAPTPPTQVEQAPTNGTVATTDQGASAIANTTSSGDADKEEDAGDNKDESDDKDDKDDGDDDAKEVKEATASQTKSS